MTIVNSNDLLRDLEESIPQGVPNATQYTVDDDGIDPDLVDLNDLLAASVSAKKQEEQYKRDRKSARAGFSGLSKEEVAFCNSRMAAFEMARMWFADKLIAVYQRCTCENCGEQQTVFSRWMEHHQHRENKTASRWIVVADSKLDNYREVLSERVVPLCPACTEADPDTMPNFNQIVNIKEIVDAPR